MKKIISDLRSEYFNERYKKWMSLSRLTFDDDLVLKSFIDFKSNFLQVRKGPYNLIGVST